MFRNPRSLALAGLFALCACTQPVSTGSQDTDAGIVRGHSVGNQEAATRSVVALVAVVDGGQALCSGTLLSEDTVLTAAHCVDHAPSKLVVVFGPRVSGATPSQMRPADAFSQNPRWLAPTDTGRGDLAVIHFSGGLVAGFEPVHLVPSTFAISTGTETLMVGYGVTNGINHAGAGILRETQTSVVGRSSETEVVTDGHKNSVCFGDSGGPAFVMKGTLALQWGVASSVTSQACNQQSVHTELSSYLTWLKTASAKMRSRHSAPRGQSRQEVSHVSLQTPAPVNESDADTADTE